MLYFTYGTMESGKTEHLIKEYKAYKNAGNHVLVWNSELDSRHKGYVSSRNEELKDIPASLYNNTANLFNKFFIKLVEHGWKVHDYKNVDECRTILFVDEAQFLTKEQVDQLSILADFEDVDVMCFGLRTDYEGNFFEGAKRLFEVADNCVNIETECRRCKKRSAIFNARFVDGKLYNGCEQVMIDNNETIKYVPLCRTCFNIVKENN